MPDASEWRVSKDTGRRLRSPSHVMRRALRRSNGCASAHHEVICICPQWNKLAHAGILPYVWSLWTGYKGKAHGPAYRWDKGTHLKRDTVIPQWFQASKAAAASDGHAVHC